MIQVYGAPPTRGIRVVWMLEELGLDYEILPLDFMKRFENPDFIAINPAAFVPVMRDGDVTMFESGAIMEYLGQRYGSAPLIPRPSDPNFPAYLQFLHFGEGSLAALLNITVGSRLFGPPEEADNYGARMAVDMMLRRSAALIPPLKRHAFIAGEAFTAADIAVAFPLSLGTWLGFDDKIDPVLRDYMARLTARPAYQRAASKGRLLS